MQQPNKSPRSFLEKANTTRLNVDEEQFNLANVLASLRRRVPLIIAIASVIATASVLKAKIDPPMYEGVFEILTNSVTGEGKAIANVPQTINSQGGVISSDSEKEVLTTIKVLQSHRILDPIIDKLKAQYPDLSYEEVLNGLTIKSKEKNILNVEYVSTNQNQVRDVSKALAEAYLNYSLVELQTDVDQAIAFVNKQSQPLERQVKLWQNKLQNIQMENNLINPVQKSQELSSQISNLQQQRTDAQIQLEQVTSQYENLRKELAQQPGEKAGNFVLTQNARYQKILDAIQSEEIEIKGKSAVLMNENPAMVNLKEKKAYLLPLLAQEEARVQKESQSRLKNLSDLRKSFDEQTKRLNSEVRNLANISRDYSNIARELQISTDALNQFITKRQALQIEKAQKQQAWRLLDPKLSQVDDPKPISRGMVKNLLVGGIAGLLLGAGAALAIDILSNIFYSAKELKNATRVPLLGIVPLIKEFRPSKRENSESEVELASHTSFFEVFRSIYINISLLSTDVPIRSLVISSVGQGEGKSTVAAQLAQTAAATGHRVLLVDANLRAPSLHTQLGTMNIQGLTDVISQDLDWNNVVEQSPFEENLFVISAGAIPPDSLRLLASQKMQNLMDNLQTTFDLVIYDTPPLLGFADAYLLSAHTDGMVLVAGLGNLKRTDLRQVLEEIQLSNTPILGMIANKSKDTKTAFYNYYQQSSQQSKSLVVSGRNTSNVR